MTTELVDVALRAADARDHDFIMDSWLRSFRSAWPEMRTGDYFRLQRRRIEQLLAMPMTAVTILHPEADRDLIVAWCCATRTTARDGSVIHYVYVREAYRRQGLATRLVQGEGVLGILLGTAMTAAAAPLKRRFDIRYQPHLLDG